MAPSSFAGLAEGGLAQITRCPGVLSKVGSPLAALPLARFSAIMQLGGAASALQPMPEELQSSHRIPLLDGIRGVAIALVLIGHSITNRDRQVLSALTGTFGVSIFFVLSGYLITRTMLADERRHGKLRLGNFYRRRALRIFPAFYVYLLALLVLSILRVIPRPDAATWLAAAGYFRNLAGTGWETGHLWSLALEEQFYLFWPVVFMLTKRRRLQSIAASIVLFTIWRAIWVNGHHGAPFAIATVGGLYWRPDLRMDTFLIGGAFAIADWRWLRTVPVVAALPILLLWCPVAVFIPALAPFDTPVTALILATVIAWLTLHQNCAVSRFLARREVVMIGAMSYSIYLWQELFLGPHLTWWSIPALGAASAGSWFLVECPFLRLRNRPTERFGKLELCASFVGTATGDPSVHEGALNFQLRDIE